MSDREIFRVAVKLPPDRRQEYLDQACGENHELRREVESLLREHDICDSFLEKPAAERIPTSTMDRASGETVKGAECALDFLTPSDKPDCLGRIGQYEISEVVGRGGMGIVLRGYDPKLNRIVAIKVLSPELASNATAHKRFLREARAAAAVKHDHVVTIYAVEESERHPGSTVRLPFLVMEFVSGCSLQQRVDQSGTLELTEILRIGAQTASGLAAAHSQGLVHRDIKPANILLENGVERVKITDFGLAKAVDDVGMTQTGMVAGTPQYMAPEQARGETVDHRADLFSLGCVIYAMCTGRSPFRAETTVAAIRRVCEETPRPIREINAEIPGWLVEIIDRLLAKDRDKRYQSAHEVSERLGECLARMQQQPSDAWQAHSTEQPALPVKKSRRWWPMIAASLVLVIGLCATEATGVTSVANFVATVLRIQTPQGTLVVELGDPEIDVTVDGEAITLSNVGPHEIRLTPGRHRFLAVKDGIPVHTEWVTISRGSKKLVEVDLEASGVPMVDSSLSVRDPSPLEPEVVSVTTDEALPVVEITKEARRFVGGHSGAIHCLACSSDGPLMLAAGHEGNIGLWELESAELIRQFQGHTKQVHTVAFSPDGKQAVSGGYEGMICLWDVETGQEIRRFEGHTGRVESVAFSPDGRTLLSGSSDWGEGADCTLRLWSAKTGEELERAEMDVHGINSVAFSPDGRMAACGISHWENTVRFWDTETWQETGSSQGKSSGARSVVWLADGRHVVSGHSGSRVKDSMLADPEKCLIRIWDSRTGKEVRRLVGHTGAVMSVACSADGRFIVSGSGGDYNDNGKFVPSDDNTVRLWDVVAGQELCRFNPGTRVLSVAMARDGRHIFSAGTEPFVRGWKMPAHVLQSRSEEMEQADAD